MAASFFSGVAPREGAWIETLDELVLDGIVTVAPREGAWIETGVSLAASFFSGVAPREGAWIETLDELVLDGIVTVAPREGAWIETFIFLPPISDGLSHPVRVRGLKRPGRYDHR